MPESGHNAGGRGEEKAWLERALSGKIPGHIGIIMDGNGRWAQKRGLPRAEGHRAGVKTLRRCLPALTNLGVKCCTFFAFSTENWKRPRAEVNFLMNLILEYASSDVSELIEHGVRLLPLGRWRELPQAVVTALDRIAFQTRDCASLTAYVAINYGGRQEIVDAALRMAQENVGLISSDLVKEADFARFLYASSMPDVDLLVRTSGEQRISNFLLWQSAYAELVFTDVLWPDFGPVDIYKAVVEFQGRDRRFGHTGRGKG